MSESQILILTIPLILAFCILISFIYSFSEMAFASSNPLKIKNISQGKTKRAKKAKKVLLFFNNSNDLFTSVVILNNILNILISTLMTLLFITIFGNQNGAILIAFIVSTIIVILFVELIPKFLARRNPEKGIIFFANFISFSSKITLPFSYLASKLLKSEKIKAFNSKQELKLALDEINKDNITTNYENKILSQTLNLSKKIVSEIMIPWEEIVYIEKNINQSKLEEIIVQNKKSRIPVVDNNIVIGIFNSKKYMLDKVNGNANSKFDLSKSMINPIFLEKDTNLNEALNIFQNQRQKIGIIIDDSNQPIGIISLYDILEQLFGKLYDESDKIKNDITWINKKTLLVKSKTKLVDFLNAIKSNLIIEKEEEDMTMNNWVKKILNVKQLENEMSFTYENMIFWIKFESELEHSILFEIDLL